MIPSILKSKGTCKPGQTAATTGCTPANGESTPKDKLEDTSSSVKQSVLNTFNKAVESCTNVKETAAELGNIGFDLLPDWAQQSVSRIYGAGKYVEHKLMLGYSKSKELAEQVAKERGMDEDQAKRLGKILGTVDLVMGWTVQAPLIGATTGSLTAMKIGTWIPAASLGYIAYSTARNPLATVRAAKKLIGKKPVEEQKMISRVIIRKGLTWQQVLIKYDSTETWVSQLGLNPKPDLTVFLVGNTRYRADTRSKTSIAELNRDGFERDDWKGKHRKSISKEAHWITLNSGKKRGEEGGGTHVLVDGGTVVGGPAALTGRPLNRLSGKQPGESNHKPSQPSNKLNPNKPVANKPTVKPPKNKPVSNATNTGQPTNSSTGFQPEGNGEPKLPKVDEGSAETQKPKLPKEPQRAPVTKDEANRRIDRFAKFFRNKGQHKQAEWMDKLKSHIDAVGTDEALRQMGEGKGDGDDRSTQYLGEQGGAEKEGEFFNDYLNRYGIVVVPRGDQPTEDLRIVSSDVPFDGEELSGEEDFQPSHPKKITNKLVESKMLPGLESSEDVSKIMGKHTTHVTPDVMKKMDEKFGKGGWIIKSYGDDAVAGYGIFFPQYLNQIIEDSKNVIWTASEQLGKYGFKLSRDDNGKISGIIHEGGDKYDFGTEEYDNTIQGDVKEWANRAAVAADNEHGVKLPSVVEVSKNTIKAMDGKLGQYGFKLYRDDEGSVAGIEHEGGDKYAFDSEEFNNTIQGDVKEWATKAEEASRNENGTRLTKDGIEFMAQPAFPIVGVTDEARARGDTWQGNKEGRVHITTKDGVAQIVPHSTWVKGDSLPVVFEDEDTKDMARAALAAVNALPKSERQGQIYAPDVGKTAEGYKAVEVNPTSSITGSGYLQDNSFTIDAYVSSLTGRDPAYVTFVRNLLSKKRGKDGTGNTVGETEQGREQGNSGGERSSRSNDTGATPETGGGKRKQSSPEALAQTLEGAGVHSLPVPSDDKQGRWDQPPHLQRLHNKQVLQAAKKTGNFIKPQDLPKTISTTPNIGGMEHDVHYDAENDRFFKLSKSGHFGQNKDVGEYLKRHEVANKLWPELDYKFLGVTQDAQGNPQTVMSMAGVAGTHPEQSEIEEMFRSNGWEPHEEVGDDETESKGVWTWMDPKSGTVIGDAHSKNFIKTAGGLAPIDIDILPGSKMPKQFSVGGKSAQKRKPKGKGKLASNLKRTTH